MANDEEVKNFNYDALAGSVPTFTSPEGQASKAEEKKVKDAQLKAQEETKNEDIEKKESEKDMKSDATPNVESLGGQDVDASVNSAPAVATDYLAESGQQVMHDPDAFQSARNPKQHLRARKAINKIAHLGVSLAKLATFSILLGGPVIGIAAFLVIKYNKQLADTFEAFNIAGTYKPIFLNQKIEPGPFQDAHNAFDKHITYKSKDGGKTTA